MVLGRRPDHAGAADVDLFDCLVERDVGPRDRFLERVEVADHNLKRHDPVLANGGGIARIGRASEDRTVNLGVQRFDPPLHDFRETRVRRNVDHGDAVFLEETSRASGRNDLKPELNEPGRKRRETGFIADADQGPLSSRGGRGGIHERSILHAKIGNPMRARSYPRSGAPSNDARARDFRSNRAEASPSGDRLRRWRAACGPSGRRGAPAPRERSQFAQERQPRPGLLANRYPRSTCSIASIIRISSRRLTFPTRWPSLSTTAIRANDPSPKLRTQRDRAVVRVDGRHTAGHQAFGFGSPVAAEHFVFEYIVIGHDARQPILGRRDVDAGQSFGDQRIENFVDCRLRRNRHRTTRHHVFDHHLHGLTPSGSTGKQTSGYPKRRLRFGNMAKNFAERPTCRRGITAGPAI